MKQTDRSPLKLFLDTNIVIDFLGNNPFHAEADTLFSFLLQGKAHGYIGASTITDICYIIRKETQSHSKAKTMIDDLMTLVDVVDTTGRDILKAIALWEFNDLEDALQIILARKAKANVLVTRDRELINKSAIPAQEAAAVVAQLAKE